MGGNGSKQDNNERDWQQFQQHSQYDQVMREAYSQNVEATYSGGYRPQGTVNPNIKSDHQSLSAVKVDFDIDPKTFKLENDPYTTNTFNLIFEVTNEAPIDIWISFVSLIQFDKNRTMVTNVKPKYPEDSRGLSLNPGKAQKINPGVFPLNFSRYSFRELSKAFNDTIPVLIVIDRKVKVMGLLEKVYYFCMIEQKSLTPSVISKSMICLNRYRYQWFFDITSRCIRPIKKHSQAYKRIRK